MADQTKILFDQKIQTTPEEFLPFIQKFILKACDHLSFVGGEELELEILPDVRPKKISLQNGAYAVIEEKISAVRPEKLIIHFFNRKIGAIHIFQIKRYPSVSQVKIWILVKRSDDKYPKGLGGFFQCKFIMKNLIDLITKEFKEQFLSSELVIDYEDQDYINLCKEAKNLGITPNRLNRWKEIVNLTALTQLEIADKLSVDYETIHKDFREMRAKGFIHT